MKKKALSFLLLILCITPCLEQCGLPDSSSFQELQPPSIVVDNQYPKCEKDSSNNMMKITLQIMVYNPEASFSGYDVYVTKNTNDISQVQSELTTNVMSHITGSSLAKIWNKDYEKRMIIANNNNGSATYPTKKMQELEPDYNKAPPKLQTIIVSSFPPEMENGGFFPSNIQLGFGVTAISMPNVKESVLSNVIILQTTPDANGRCKIISQS